MPKLFSIGGYVAAAVLIVFGLAVIVIGAVGRSYVQDQLAKEQIVGSDDMTPRPRSRPGSRRPACRASRLRPARWPARRSTPARKRSASPTTCASTRWRPPAARPTRRCRSYATDDGKGTNEAAEASKNADGSPQSNAARDIWVTETALTTALYTSYFAENVALFAIIVGIAMLLVGIGFVVLMVFARRQAPAAAATESESGSAVAT